MTLSDNEIQLNINDGQLVIDPFDPALIEPASIDLRLHNVFKEFREGDYALDPEQDADQYMETMTLVDREALAMEPGDFLLGATLETVTIGVHRVGQLVGKSSLGRLGLMVHVTAGLIDPGFSGRITLELVNTGPKPIILRPGMLIAQLMISRMYGHVERPYGHGTRTSRYQGDDGPAASRGTRRWAGPVLGSGADSSPGT